MVALGGARVYRRASKGTPRPPRPSGHDLATRPPTEGGHSCFASGGAALER